MPGILDFSLFSNLLYALKNRLIIANFTLVGIYPKLTIFHLYNSWSSHLS